MKLSKPISPEHRKDNREELEEDAVLQMYAAEQQGLGQIQIDFDENNFAKRLETVICNESYGDIATKWNERRRVIARRVYQDYILPDLTNYIKTTMLKDAQDALASKLEASFSYVSEAKQAFEPQFDTSDVQQ